ncbi:hypothetical protein MSG28_002568 [Choristoneura fumiferana]|uniref:Uncharacterized protein n=1 Tax=Choristoneura fumiferana TaxID=7141 RepID=A0ACC0JW80_CHOFU|nr:hypothetical protein MSG28_002568 [Choristoneura fumiferana]
MEQASYLLSPRVMCHVQVEVGESVSVISGGGVARRAVRGRGGAGLLHGARRRVLLGPRRRRAGRAPAAGAARPAAAADCRSWHDLRRADCRFLAPRDERLDEELPPPSRKARGRRRRRRGWRGSCASARARCGPPPPLRPVALRPAALQRALRHHGRSFLFVDYDWWQAQDAAGGERVQPAPPLPGAAPAAAVSVLAAPLKLIKKYMPRVPCVLERFRPAPATLRRLLRNERALGPDEAACEAAASARGALRHWVDCPEPPSICTCRRAATAGASTTSTPPSEASSRTTGTRPERT